MVRLEKFVIHTTKYNDFINITDRVEELVEQSGIREGMALVMTAHTTTGITANGWFRNMGIMPTAGCFIPTAQRPETPQAT